MDVKSALLVKLFECFKAFTLDEKKLLQGRIFIILFTFFIFFSNYESTLIFFRIIILKNTLFVIEEFL